MELGVRIFSRPNVKRNVSQISDELQKMDALEDGR